MDLSRFTTIHPTPVAVSPASKDQQISIEGILTERKDLSVKEGNEISPGKEGDLAERNPAEGISVSTTGSRAEVRRRRRRRRKGRRRRQLGPSSF